MSGCTGSAVWSTNLSLSQGYNIANTTRESTMKEDLSSIDYLGNTGADFRMNPLSAHFELHIEQERNLQDSRKDVGIVVGIQGVRWYMVTMVGVQGHAGSTPMQGRADPHVAVAEIIIQVQKLALKYNAVGTVGVIRTENPSTNKIPDHAEFSIDFRHPNEKVLDAFERHITAELTRISRDNPKFNWEMTRTWSSPVADFDGLAIDCIRASATKEVGPDKVMEMISFAGHDSALVSKRVPTAMIFVPCRDGISHSPLEYSSNEQWYVLLYSKIQSTTDFHFGLLSIMINSLTSSNSGQGAQVLLGAVLSYDKLLRKYDANLGASGQKDGEPELLGACKSFQS